MSRETSESNNSTKKFVVDILNYAPSKFVPAIITIIWSYVFTRVFSASDYGIYGMSLAIISATVTIITEWAAQPIGRYYAQYMENEDLQVVFFNTVKKLLVLIIIISIIVSIIALVIVSYYWMDYFQIAFCSVMVLAINSVMTLVKPILPASLDAKSFRKIEILRNVARLIIALLLIFSFSKNISYLVLADFIASFLLVIPLLVIVYRKINVNSSKGSNSDNDTISLLIKRFINYGTPMMMWFFCSQLLNVGDRFVIQHFYGSNDVGIYTANYTLISGVASLLGVPISLAAFPLIMKLWAKDKKNDIPVVLYNMTKIFAMLAVGLIGGTVVVGRDFVNLLLDNEYSAGYSVLIPTVIGIAFVQASMLGQKGIELYESTLSMVYCMIVAALINLALNFYFVPLFGYVAAAWSTALSYLIYASLIWVKSKNSIRWRIPVKFITVISLVAIVSSYGAMRIELKTDLLNFIIQGLVFVCLYAILVYLYLRLNKIKTGDYM